MRDARRVVGLLALAMVAGMLECGCGSKEQGRWEGVEIERASFDEVWQACLGSVKQRGLQVDREDRRFGLIVTKPVVGKQFFEFWRKDAVTSNDVMLSSLHTVRRVVKIQIVPQGTMRFGVNVEAHVERASIPGDQLDNTAEAFELLNRQGVPASPSRRDYTRPQREPVWVDIGREPAMERVLMEDIVRRLKS